MSEISQATNEHVTATCNTDSDSCMEEVKSENYLFYVTKSSLETSVLQMSELQCNDFVMDLSNAAECSMKMDDSTDCEESPSQTLLPVNMTLQENLATSVKSFLERACTETEVNSYRRTPRKRRSTKTKRAKRDYKSWNRKMYNSKTEEMPSKHENLGLLPISYSLDQNMENKASELQMCLKNDNGKDKNNVSSTFKENESTDNHLNCYLSMDVESNLNVNETQLCKKSILKSNESLITKHNVNPHTNELPLSESKYKTHIDQYLYCNSNYRVPLRAETSILQNIANNRNLNDDPLKVEDDMLDKDDCKDISSRLTLKKERMHATQDQGYYNVLPVGKKNQDLEWNKPNLKLLGIELSDDEEYLSNSGTKLPNESGKLKEEYYPTIPDLLSMSGGYRNHSSPQYLYYLHRMAQKKVEDEEKQTSTEDVKQVSEPIKHVEPTVPTTTTNQAQFRNNTVLYPHQIPLLPPVYAEHPISQGDSTMSMPHQFLPPPWPPYAGRPMMHYNSALGLQQHRKVPSTSKQDSFVTIPTEYQSVSTNINLGQVPKPHPPVTRSMEVPTSYQTLPGAHPWLIKPNRNTHPYSWRNYLAASGRYPSPVAWSHHWARAAGRTPMMPPLVTSSINNYINSARMLLNNNNNIMNQYGPNVWEPSQGMYSRVGGLMGPMAASPHSYPTLSEIARHQQLRAMHPGLFQQYASPMTSTHPEQAPPPPQPAPPPTQNRRRKLEEIVDRLKEVEKDN